MSKEPDVVVKCPICGKTAERGCVYGADRIALQWSPGPPNWKSNFETGLGAGLQVGEWTLGAGAYVEGIRCQACRRIILDG